MAPNNNTALTPNQIAQLETLFFATSQDPRWLARRIGAHVQSVRAYLRRSDWYERLAYTRFKDREKREAAEAALCDGHFEVARTELAARQLAARRIAEHLVDCPIDQVPKFMKLLGTVRDLQAVQRLAAGMSTERTEHDVTSDRFEELQQKLLDAMLAGAGEEDEDVPGGDPSGPAGAP